MYMYMYICLHVQCTCMLPSVFILPHPLSLSPYGMCGSAERRTRTPPQESVERIFAGVGECECDDDDD